MAALAQVVIEKTHVGFDNVELENANQGDEEQLFKPPGSYMAVQPSVAELGYFARPASKTSPGQVLKSRSAIL